MLLDQTVWIDVDCVAKIGDQNCIIPDGRSLVIRASDSMEMGVLYMSLFPVFIQLDTFIPLYEQRAWKCSEIQNCC